MPDVLSEDDNRNTDNLLSKGIRADVVAGMSAARRQVLAERLRTQPTQDRGIFIWLVTCFAIIAVTALFSMIL